MSASIAIRLSVMNQSARTKSMNAIAGSGSQTLPGAAILRSFVPPLCVIAMMIQAMTTLTSTPAAITLCRVLLVPRDDVRGARMLVVCEAVASTSD